MAHHFPVVLPLGEILIIDLIRFRLTFAQLLYEFAMREEDENIFLNQVPRNKFIWMAVILCIAVLAVACFIPFSYDILFFHQLEFRLWALITISSLLPTRIIQKN